ncbi:MAG: tetratricopeptide repeat protein, partial [Deltaproteobacteria bacterium]|nr:tetratricopeptide repeat protein [Deltaproteobacteria bacterium]
MIGRYRDVDRAPGPEPMPVTIAHDPMLAEPTASPRSSRPLPGLPGLTPMSASGQPTTIPTRIPQRRMQTDPIDDSELANLRVGDQTQPLDVNEIEMAAAAGPADRKSTPFMGENPTMSLSPQDLRGMMVPPRLPPGGKAPPKPPPRPPQIQRNKSGTMPPPSPLVPRKAQAPVRRPPLPTLPNRSYESPWEELAVCYESLPAADTDARLRWLYRASEVWETGGKDITRAFDALARAFAQARHSPTGDGEVRARLHRIAQEHKAWDRLAELYEGLAESAETAAAAADLLMEVAQIRAEQKRPREAEAQLRRILGMLPNDEVSRTRLEELYRSEGRWVELAASLEERTDPRLGTAAPEAERPLLLYELASIYTERLNRPHDAIDAFERLRLIAPSDVEVLFNLANLYGRIDRWSKVIETLSRVDEIAEGSQQARDALHSIARIYVKELELPERAIEAYARLVVTWPDDTDAWTQLDTLYMESGKWSELADVLRRRAALEREPSERALLLARRAQVLLDWLSSPEEAAAALRHARTLTAGTAVDATLGDLLVSALVKAGRDREAAAILEDRIDSAQAPAPGISRADPAAGHISLATTESEVTLSRGDLAALHIRLAQLRHGRLGDPAGAREAIEQALALVPEHPTALGVLAEIASPDDDPQSFANAKLREADSATDDDAKIAALMAAGEVLQSRVGDTAGARTTFQRVLALRPYHSDATWALAGLVEKGGDPETAARLLEKRLDDESLTPPEKARIMT